MALKRQAAGRSHLGKGVGQNKRRKPHEEGLEFPLRNEASNEVQGVYSRAALGHSTDHASKDHEVLTIRPIPSYVITQPIHGLRRHARTGIEEDTAGLPGLLAEAVPMILPLELPQAA